LTPVVVEPSPDGARNAVRRGLSPAINATLADAGFGAACTGGVGLFDVLEHIEDEAGFLSVVRHCLQPEGRRYPTVPAYRWLWSDEDTHAGHFRHYSGPCVRSTLPAADGDGPVIVQASWRSPERGTSLAGSASPARRTPGVS
jgi:hypothetical protein